MGEVKRVISDQKYFKANTRFNKEPVKITHDWSYLNDIEDEQRSFRRAEEDSLSTHSEA